MLSQAATKYPRFRAPRDDGQSLVTPRGDAIDELLSANRSLIAGYDYDVQGRSLAELAHSARIAIINRAVGFTAAYRDVPNAWRDPEFVSSHPLFLAGHQPELVHPGVWFKNFVLGRLAQRHQGVALQLVIDSDLCRTAAIRVPTGTLEIPRVEAVSYDTQLPELPYEERRVDDLALAASFAERAEDAIRPFVSNPLVTRHWPLVLSALQRHENLGLALAQGRHMLEAEWGNQTLELPSSQVCESTEFRWFASHVLAQLPRFRRAYNDALSDYRRANHVRNRAQPVPKLAEADGWLEAPFWIWTADRPIRQPLWVRRAGEQLEISDRGRLAFHLELTESGTASKAVEQLAEVAARGIKIRTRALLTTLFSRLILGDLFLHGIGGAKYDQVTDELARRFFGFAAPGYMTLSATLRLPIDHKRASRDLLGELSHNLRELKYHPEKYLESADSEARSMVATKHHWIDVAKTPANAAVRHRAIVSANQSLERLVEHPRQELLARQAELAQRLRASSILESREYAFCLYPAGDLKRRLLDLAAREA